MNRGHKRKRRALTARLKTNNCSSPNERRLSARSVGVQPVRGVQHASPHMAFGKWVL